MDFLNSMKLELAPCALIWVVVDQAEEKVGLESHIIYSLV